MAKSNRIFWLVVGASMLASIAWAKDDSVDVSSSTKAVEGLRSWIGSSREERKPLAEQPFASTPLTKTDAAAARDLLWADHVESVKATRGEEMKAKVLKVGNTSMKFDSLVFPPEKAAEGDAGKDADPPRPALFISMHGGGGAPPQVNESQWVNQIRLGRAYQPKNAIYVAPRAPGDSWDLWHTAVIDGLFDRLIEDMVVFANVDPNQVYLMGYSAGGDGAYQLAPRMADRLAAASAMAGHPNNSSPRGLRNLPFTIHVGGEDAAYGRNKVAENWDEQLNALKKADPNGYEHFVHVHAGKGHWMDMDDKEAIPWMQKFRRNPLPERIVWRQGNVLHDRFYWLASDRQKTQGGDEIVAERKGQMIAVDIGSGHPRVKLLLNDAMVDLDQPLTVTLGGKETLNGRVPRTIATLERTLVERGDPELIFSAEYELPEPPAAEPPN